MYQEAEAAVTAANKHVQSKNKSHWVFVPPFWMLVLIASLPRPPNDQCIACTQLHNTMCTVKGSPDAGQKAAGMTFAIDTCKATKMQRSACMTSWHGAAQKIQDAYENAVKGGSNRQ